MLLSELSPGVLFQFLDGSQDELFMRGSQTEPGIYSVHRVAPDSAYSEELGTVQVKQVRIVRMQLEEVE